MQTTIDLDDDLLAQARMVTGLEETSVLVSEALGALIQRESARQLARSLPALRPDPFELEAHNQSFAVANDRQDADDQAFIDSISDLSDR